jgi:hypothetical protein
MYILFTNRQKYRNVDRANALKNKKTVLNLLKKDTEKGSFTH